MVFALIVHSLFNISNLFDISDQIQYPLVIAITPYIISKLPLLGTKDLMTQGAQPLLSLIFLILCTIGVQYITKQIKTNSQNDFLSKFLKEKKYVSYKGFKVKRETLNPKLAVVLLSEFIFQSLVSKNEHDKLEKTLLKVLTKFHGKK